MVPRYPEFFNDVFGPVMQPGSSSHFAGPCRIGLLAASLLDGEPSRVELGLDRTGLYL
jgi:L-serine dehydratase